MGYIKFNLSRITDNEGNTITAKVSRMESDMPTRMSPIYIYHELARTRANDIRMWLKLNEGLLNRDMLGGVDSLILDVGIFDCDLMV